MNKNVKRSLYGLLGAVIALIAVALIWSILPVSDGEGAADPTVVFENQRQGTTEQYTESYFAHNGLKLHYVETGKPTGEVIVFVHGFPSFWYSFVRQIDALRSNYRIIAIDGLGAGRSSAPNEVDAYKMENMASHLEALITHLNLEKVHLVGHDWGAVMVYSLAKKYPERVSTVTGISAPPLNIMLEMLVSSPEQRQASHYVERLKGANPILVKAVGGSERIWQDFYLQMVGSGQLSMPEAQQFRVATSSAKRINAHINWYRANIPQVESISADDFWPGRRSVLQIPAMIIWGRDDPYAVEGFIELLQQQSLELTVHKLDDVGHWPHLERSSFVNSALSEFIGRHEQ